MINRGDIKLAIDMVVNAQDDQLFGGEAEYVINTLEDCGNTIAAQAADIEWMRGVSECHAIDLRERDAAIKFHAEKVRSQAAVIESNKEVFEYLLNQLGDIKDIKIVKAALVTPTYSTQILDEVRRAERERVITLLNASFGYLADYDLHQMSKAIRAME